jgi:CRP-like cAMP-binding protein
MCQIRLADEDFCNDGFCMSTGGCNTDGAEKSLAETIASHALFHGLPAPYVRLLADVAMYSDFETNELIFRQGDPANRFYLLLTGQVVLQSADGRSGPVVIERIGPDDVLGWSWLFPPYHWHFDARATQPTRAIFFYGTWLRENCDRDRAFGYEMMKRMAGTMLQRLQAGRQRLVELSPRASHSS